MLKSQKLEIPLLLNAYLAMNQLQQHSFFNISYVIISTTVQIRVCVYIVKVMYFNLSTFSDVQQIPPGTPCIEHGTNGGSKNN